MSSNSTIPAGIDIAAVSGPLIVGELLHWGLFGTLSVQIYLYYLAFPRDKPILKVIAYSVYILELIQTILVTNDAFHAYGSGFGNYAELTSMHLNWFSIPIMSGIVSCAGQLFFAYRIWILSKSRLIPGIIAVMSFTSSVAGFMTGVYVKEAGQITNLHQVSTKIAVAMWCGMSALCDLFIAACMTYFLSRSDTNFKRTRLLMAKLIRLTIETGSVTATVALINLILVTGFPDKTYYATVSLIIPKTYANTLLVILNSRFRIVGGRDSDDHSTFINSTIPQISLDDRRSSNSSVGLQTMLPAQTFPQKSFSCRTMPQPTSGDISRPGSSGRATIQISVHNEVITDGSNGDHVEAKIPSQSELV